MNDPISILIVDDHAVVRRGARAFLDAEEDFVVVGDVGSGGEAILLIADLVPDVVLMDLVMPNIDGVETTRWIKQKSPRSQIIVLTSYHDDEHIFPALRAGALSYLLKDVPLSDLADAIRKAARGEAVIHSFVATRLVQELEEEKGHSFRQKYAYRPASKQGACLFAYRSFLLLLITMTTRNRPDRRVPTYSPSALSNSRPWGHRSHHPRSAGDRT